MYTKENIKANPDIFENIQIIDIANILTLSPILLSDFELEAEYYLKNSSDSEIKHILPGAYVKTLSEAKAKLNEFIFRMLMYDSLLYTIRQKDSKIPIGYILLNSPLSNTGLNEWSIDFWLSKEYRGKKVMASSIMQILGLMQKMEIEYVYALVDEYNQPSIELLSKFGFTYINKSENLKRPLLLYTLMLNDV